MTDMITPDDIHWRGIALEWNSGMWEGFAPGGKLNVVVVKSGEGDKFTGTVDGVFGAEGWYPTPHAALEGALTVCLAVMSPGTNPHWPALRDLAATPMALTPEPMPPKPTSDPGGMTQWFVTLRDYNYGCAHTQVVADLDEAKSYAAYALGRAQAQLTALATGYGVACDADAVYMALSKVRRYNLELYQVIKGYIERSTFVAQIVPEAEGYCLTPCSPEANEALVYTDEDMKGSPEFVALWRDYLLSAGKPVPAWVTEHITDATEDNQ